MDQIEGWLRIFDTRSFGFAQNNIMRCSDEAPTTPIYIYYILPHFLFLCNCPLTVAARTGKLKKNPKGAAPWL